VGFKELFAVIPFKGALNYLKNLVISYNEIGNEGMKAFAETLSKGVMEKLNELYIYGDGFSCEVKNSLKEVCITRKINCHA